MRVTRRNVVRWVALAACSAMKSNPGTAAPRNYKGQDVGGKSFSGQNLAGVDFSDSTLSQCDFTHANLKGANFRGANLKFARFDSAVLAEADLRDIVGPFLDGGTGTDYTGANLEGVDLKGASFYGAVFNGANLKDTNGWGAIPMCHFENADVRGANFRSAWIAGSNPRGQVNMWPKFQGALFDKATVWPSWYDVEESGARMAN